MQTSIKTIGLLAALAMVLTSSLSPVQAAEHFWDEIPVSPSTTMPSEVLDDYWNSEFQRVNREVAAAQNTRLVFFGDSITCHGRSAPPPVGRFGKINSKIIIPSTWETRATSLRSCFTA